MAQNSIRLMRLLVVVFLLGAAFVSHALEQETIMSNINIFDIPASNIIEIFLDFEKSDNEKEIADNSFKNFICFTENNKRYPVMPLVSKQLWALFKTHGIRKTSFGILMTPKKTASEEAIDLATILASAQHTQSLKKKMQKDHVCNSIIFASPYALTLVLLVMNVAHQALFDSYFAHGAWAMGETVVAALAIVLSISGCVSVGENGYSCCGRMVKGSKCGVFYGMLFHTLLGIGNLLNVAFSCLSRECSTGAYLPITAPTAVVCLAVLLCGSQQLFCPDKYCKNCSCC